MAPDPVWLTSSAHEALVSTHTHSLYLRVRGPPGKEPSQPVVVLGAGGGACGYSFVAVARAISKFARVYWYDRSGLGNSEKFPEGTPSTTLNHVHALRQLLEAAGVEPPFVLVGHSYGGNIMRFLQESMDAGEAHSVAGMLLLDAPPIIPDELPVKLGELLGPERDYFGAIGRSNAVKLSEAEMEMLRKEQSAGQQNGATAAEVYGVRAGLIELNKRQDVEIQDGKVICTRAVLGDHRLCVLKGDIRGDFEKIKRYGLEHGYGSEDAKKELEKFLDTWPTASFQQLQDAMVGLSSNSRLVQAEGEGRTHILHMTVPDFIAENVHWVVGEA